MRTETVVLFIVFAGLLAGPAGLVWLIWRERRRAEREPTWGSPIAEMAPADPLDTAEPVPCADLAPALLFDEVAAANPLLRLDWEPLSFTQEWLSLGQQLRELGDTTEMPAVAA